MLGLHDFIYLTMFSDAMSGVKKLSLYSGTNHCRSPTSMTSWILSKSAPVLATRGGGKPARGKVVGVPRLEGVLSTSALPRLDPHRAVIGGQLGGAEWSNVKAFCLLLEGSFVVAIDFPGVHFCSSILQYFSCWQLFQMNLFLENGFSCSWRTFRWI